MPSISPDTQELFNACYASLSSAITASSDDGVKSAQVLRSKRSLAVIHLGEDQLKLEFSDYFIDAFRVRTSSKGELTESIMFSLERNPSISSEFRLRLDNFNERELVREFAPLLRHLDQEVFDGQLMRLAQDLADEVRYRIPVERLLGQIHESLERTSQDASHPLAEQLGLDQVVRRGDSISVLRQKQALLTMEYSEPYLVCRIPSTPIGINRRMAFELRCEVVDDSCTLSLMGINPERMNGCYWPYLKALDVEVFEGKALEWAIRTHVHRLEDDVNAFKTNWLSLPEPYGG